MFAIMIRKLFALFFLLILSLSSAVPAAAQRKEIAQAKDNVKAGKKLAEAEDSMRHLLPTLPIEITIRSGWCSSMPYASSTKLSMSRCI